MSVGREGLATLSNTMKVKVIYPPFSHSFVQIQLYVTSCSVQSSEPMSLYQRKVGKIRYKCNTQQSVITFGLSHDCSFATSRC